MKTAVLEHVRASVPTGKGVKVEKAVTIGLPVQEVYSFWWRLENLPRFMPRLESVVRHDDKHSRWTVKTPGGKRVQWEAEIIEDRENEIISWRSLPGSDVDNAGSVWFTPASGGRGTVVKVALKYLPPAGKAGAVIDRLLGRDAAAEIEEDLFRLKALLETGEIPTVAGQPRGSAQGGAR